MKLNIKLFFVAALSFAAGFVACLVLGVSMSRDRSSTPVTATSSTVAFAQAQPEMIVLRPFHRPPLQQKVQDTINFVPEIELIQPRSLHLIDARARFQQQSDFKELDK